MIKITFLKATREHGTTVQAILLAFWRILYEINWGVSKFSGLAWLTRLFAYLVRRKKKDLMGHFLRKNNQVKLRDPLNSTGYKINYLERHELCYDQTERHIITCETFKELRSYRSIKNCTGQTKLWKGPKPNPKLWKHAQIPRGTYNS